VGKVTHSSLEKDRAGNYDVKVFSGAASDVVLSQMSKESFSYLAMIDAGSSGCRAHVYRYGKLNSIDGPLYMLPQHDSKKVKPGLSSFAKKPTEAGASLQGLVDFIKTQVPEAQWVNTPIWLKATAGMRLIPETESTAVLDSVREFLGNKKNSPFIFHKSWARIISGNEEGGFGWIAFNYLKKIIGPKKVAGLSPYAVVEMGGASSQVSQLAPSQKEADEIPPNYRFSFTIEGLIIQL
jgi:Golgi nucleoside diphosphatase